ncbi:MAG: hypothetical protein HY904_24950 [Deltaproteobacteria bacterium]|nr:hypothetical protein [Deltaproteobacteria bacterium]
MRAFIIPCLVLAAWACADNQDTAHRCVFEEQESQGCGEAPSGPWETKCYDAEEGSAAYDTQCAVYDDDTECGGGCCLQFRVRNRRFEEGSCAEGGY